MAAQRRAVSSAKSGRVAQRLKQRIEDGQFYEAHQTYKVLYQRYCAQGKKKAAMELLYDGASRLLGQNQWESGTDLAIMFTRHLKQELTPVTQDLLDQIRELFLLYSGPREFATDIPAQSQVKIEVDPREHFMRAALKWSSIVEEGKYKYGHPFLHHLLAITFFKEKQFSKARDHFLYAGDPENFGALLIEMAGPESAVDADVIITGAVLQLLVLRELESASGTYTAYVKNHGVIRDLQGPPYKDWPLLNFTHSLIKACQEGDVVAYKGLRQQYATAAVSTPDPTYGDYLDKIGVAYFDQPATTSSSNGPQATNGFGGAGLMGLLGGGASGGGLLENLIGSISNSIPDPPFLQDNDFVPPALTLTNGDSTHHQALDGPAHQPPLVDHMTVTEDDTLD